MKNLYFLFLYFLCQIDVAAQKPHSSFTDTIFYITGEIEMTTVYALFNGKWVQHGKHMEYNVDGSNRVEGGYKYSKNTLACYQCFEVFDNSSFHQYKQSRCHQIRIGEWKFYDKEGRLTKKGSYSQKVNEQFSSTYQGSDRPKPVGVSTVYLEHGKWIHFDVNGNENAYYWYNNGQLIKIEHL